MSCFPELSVLVHQGGAKRKKNSDTQDRTCHSHIGHYKISQNANFRQGHSETMIKRDKTKAHHNFFLSTDKSKITVQATIHPFPH